MVMTREESLKMADTFCDRIDRRLFSIGVHLHSRVNPMGKLELHIYKNEDGVKTSRTIRVDDFSRWTSERFSEFEDAVFKELSE